jgi:hypothetical protein
VSHGSAELGHYTEEQLRDEIEKLVLGLTQSQHGSRQPTNDAGGTMHDRGQQVWVSDDSAGRGLHAGGCGALGSSEAVLVTLVLLAATPTPDSARQYSIITAT